MLLSPGAILHLTYFIDDFLEQLLLICYAQSLAGNQINFESQNHDGVLSRACAMYPITPRIQLRPHGLDVLPDRGQHLRAHL